MGDRLATIDMGREMGGLRPFELELDASVISNPSHPTDDIGEES